jgi:hypothetical protein
MKSGTTPIVLLLLALFLSMPRTAHGAVQGLPNIVLETILSGLDQPVFVGNAGDGSNRLFILEQPGRIRVLQPGSTQPTTFLNITSRVLCCGEQGLLGLAFHPQFASNRRFFVNYTRAGDGATVIAEYLVSEDDANVANTSENVLLTIGQPFANHNGGMLAFGPDGYLYIATGDGGSGNDPGDRAQNINDLLGKILRIDVNQPPYASPSTNPFFGATPGRDEIYAVGLRNPWRFSFDRATGQLYVGDVGQNAREEVDIVTLGGNYGWRVFEGTLCTNLGPAPCSTPGFTGPIAEYGHTGGRCSVTGGYAYRGAAAGLPPGSYLYADFCSGEIFLFHNGVAQLILDTDLNISSFGEDESGEHYVVNLNGTVSRITTPLPTPTLAGVVPASGLIGSTVNVTLTGTGFTSGLSIDAGNGVTASNIQVSTSTAATATLAISGNAALGVRPVTVATGGGVSGPVSFSVIPPPPTLDNPTIASGAPGATVNVTVTGTNLIGPSIAVEGGDVAVSNVNATSSTTVTATFTVSPTATLGTRAVTVTTTGGTSTASFLVGNPVPVISSITPSVVVRGTAAVVTLQGSGFAVGATTIEALPGITIRDTVAQGFTRVTATFEAAADATLGVRSVRVTTAGGTSEPINFTVTNPFPDLEIAGAHSRVFGAGFDESYTVTIRNAGSVPTSGTMHVADVLPNGLSFVSAGGAGWSCSAQGATVACANSSVLEPDSATSFTLTVAVDAGAAPGVTHIVVVSMNGDLNSANNIHSDPTQVLAPPTPAFAFTPSSALPAGQQAAVALTVGTPFPHDLSGALRLLFSPDPAVGIDDPAIQFETGGRNVAFVIPANSGQARFSGFVQEGPIQFQTGTVAGSLQFQGTLVAGRLESTFSSSGSSLLTIPRQPPVIQNLRTSTEGGFAALITSYSTARQITQLILDFNTSVPVALSCGAAPGCSASGNRITLNVAGLFGSWFGSDMTFGSLSTLRLPLSIAGAVQGSVTVTLRNDRGASNSQSFSLP